MNVSSCAGVECRSINSKGIVTYLDPSGLAQQNGLARERSKGPVFIAQVLNAPEDLGSGWLAKIPRPDHSRLPTTLTGHTMDTSSASLIEYLDPMTCDSESSTGSHTKKTDVSCW